MLAYGKALERALAHLLVIGLTLTGVGTASGDSIDTSFRETVLLPISKQFIAPEHPNGLALYRLSDLSLVHRFRAPAPVGKFAVTSDESLLLLACDDGTVSCYGVATGESCWALSPSQSGLGCAHDICPAHDGKSVVVCDREGRAAIFEAATGRRIRSLPLPPDGNILSASLAPDGTQGVFAGSGMSLYCFDVASGKITDTGERGPIAHIRYSIDGKYIALHVVGAAGCEQLRLVTREGNWRTRALGTPGEIGNLKPSMDGGFLVTKLEDTLSPSGEESGVQLVGLRWRPGAEGLEALWRRPTSRLEVEKTDFLPDCLIGVSTDYRFVTQVINLRTGSVCGVVDNSVNYRRPLPITMSPELTRLARRYKALLEESALARTGAVVAVLAAVCLIWRVLRYQGRRRPLQK